MATVVCRGLQSCLDSHLVEQRTFMLMKFSSPKPHFSQPFELPLKPPFSDCSTPADEAVVSEKCDIEEIMTAKNGGSGGWTFLQALSTSLQPGGKEATQRQEIYVHPLAKRSNSTSLSEKSLKLCTENLGNETGADIIENNIFSSELGGGNFLRKQKMKSHPQQFLGTKKVNSQNFPPPLTTMRELESFRVKPHREEGRLVIEAVKTPARQSCFQAERSHGRLRLCFSRTEETEASNEEIDEEEEIEDFGGNELEAEMEVEETNENEEACSSKEGRSKTNALINLEQLSVAAS